MASHTVLTSASRPPLSDKSSVVSLSDKYRQQEEVEVFHETFNAKKPPEPIRPSPPKKSDESNNGSVSTAKSSIEQ